MACAPFIPYHLPNDFLMSKNDQKTEKKHQRFVQEACKQGTVWALKRPEGYAITHSIQYSTTEGEPMPMFCFWSDKGLAGICAQKEWEEYKPEQISLSEFIEGWCIGLANDDILIGSNFDQNMIGYEAEPLMLILELTHELKQTKRKVEFQHFSNIADLESQIKDVLA